MAVYNCLACRGHIQQKTCITYNIKRIEGMEKLNSYKFWVSPTLIPTTEDIIPRSDRERRSFHDESFLNRLIEAQVI